MLQRQHSMGIPSNQQARQDTEAYHFLTASIHCIERRDRIPPCQLLLPYVYSLYFSLKPYHSTCLVWHQDVACQQIVVRKACRRLQPLRSALHRGNLLLKSIEVDGRMSRLLYSIVLKDKASRHLQPARGYPLVVSWSRHHNDTVILVFHGLRMMSFSITETWHHWHGVQCCGVGAFHQ